MVRQHGSCVPVPVVVAHVRFPGGDRHMVPNIAIQPSKLPYNDVSPFSQNTDSLRPEDIIKMLSRRSVALLVAVFMVVQTVRPTLSHVLRSNVRREPVPPKPGQSHPPKRHESLPPKPSQPHPPHQREPVPPKPDQTSRLLVTLQRIRTELVRYFAVILVKSKLNYTLY